MSIEYLSAFGLGALVVAIFQALFNFYQRKITLAFQEKKEAYVGLLEAYHEAAIEGDDRAAKNFAYWQMRCELVSNTKVRKAIQAIVDTNENPLMRYEAHEKLKEALRVDLGIS